MDIQKSLFDDLIGESFKLQNVDGHALSLILKSVESPEQHITQRARELGIREPFSLLFFGPIEPFLESGMYEFEHEALSKIDLFLVPVQEEEKGFYYETVFG